MNHHRRGVMVAQEAAESPQYLDMLVAAEDMPRRGRGGSSSGHQTFGPFR